jgi:hypothetical protein
MTLCAIRVYESCFLKGGAIFRNLEPAEECADSSQYSWRGNSKKITLIINAPQSLIEALPR